MSQSEKILFDNRIKRKNVLALNEKVAAIREFEKRPVYKHVGRSFSCSPDQIKRIIQQKDEILKAWEQRTRRSNEVKSLEMKSVRVSMLGKSVYEWIRRMMYYKDFIITDGLIQKMALQFKSALGIQIFFPHQDWCDKFRQTYKISENDTKKLKIAYAQGHSVQIKDIIRDILGTCTPDRVDDDETTNNMIHQTKEEVDDDEEDMEPSDDEDYVEENVEQTTRKSKYKPVLRPKRQVSKKQMAPPKPLPAIPKRHLVTVQLPFAATGMQKNGTKMSQKVLVATPITQGSNGPGAPPMTMTIIPLTSVTQSLNCVKKTKLTCEKPIVPPPKVEIKREIEEEPVTIKKEYISDDEDMPMENDEHEKENSKMSTTHKSATTSNKESPELSEEEDNLALAQLQKGLASKTNDTLPHAEENSMSRTSTPISPLSLPAMPPLTRAPTANSASTSSTKRRHANHDHSPPLPPIRTCAEARKYLKLLEDFALVKENFRLIGLITRADEVLRELDGDEDVDVV